jgi:hypothetical protein
MLLYKVLCKWMKSNDKKIMKKIIKKKWLKVVITVVIKH